MKIKNPSVSIIIASLRKEVASHKIILRGMSAFNKKHIFLLGMVLSTAKGESDHLENEGGPIWELPPVEKLGHITKGRVQWRKK